MDVVIGQLFAGVSQGSILLLIALGLALTFGQMGVINMAHGEFIMAGAYTAYVMQQVIGRRRDLPAGRHSGRLRGRRAARGDPGGHPDPADVLTGRWTRCWSPGGCR